MTSLDPIQFGTDGWRAIIGEGFTSNHVARVIHAFGQCYQAAKTTNQAIIIGYDARFLADRFAWLAAQQLLEQGFQVILSQTITTTPGLSAAIVEHQAAAGLMFTASHNPASYLGIKIKSDYGGSATTQIIEALVTILKNTPTPTEIVFLPTQPPKNALLEDLNQQHLKRVATYLSISAGSDHLVHDAMYGSAQGLLAELLTPLGCHVHPIRSIFNPGFGGQSPEPIAQYLGPMFNGTREKKANFGIATDGDGDRIAACDHEGHYVAPHELFALSIIFLVDYLGKRGRVVRSVSTSELVKQVAQARGLEVTTVPVGFKHTVSEMLKGDVLIGGEESGGIAIAQHLPERDAILNAVLLRELVLQTNKPLQMLVAELYQQHGACVFRRQDIHLTTHEQNRFVEVLTRQDRTSLGSFPIISTERLDGIKYWFADNRWVLLRLSGTEPLLRVYVEAKNEQEVESFFTAVRALLIS